jgi:hypothetical protein
MVVTCCGFGELALPTWTRACEVSKAAASQLIEQMVADQKEAAHGNA